jgi:hypothetical protein
VQLLKNINYLQEKKVFQRQCVEKHETVCPINFHKFYGLLCNETKDSSTVLKREAITERVSQNCYNLRAFLTSFKLRTDLKSINL